MCLYAQQRTLSGYLPRLNSNWIYKILNIKSPGQVQAIDFGSWFCAIFSEQITTQNVYYRLLYLISCELFFEKGVLIFKGGLEEV